MPLRNVAQALASLGLAVTLAGCGATGAVNGQQASAMSSVPAATSSAATVVVTRTVVVTSTVFATASTSSTASPVSSSASSTASVVASQAATIAAVSTAAPSTQAPHVTPTSAPGGLAITAASQVTLAFFSALQQDSSGGTSAKYLSSRLQAVVRSGHSVASIVGIQNMYPRYQADPAISRGGGRAATVRVTLDYAAGPIQRLVTLIPENGAWHIDDIADNSA